MNTLSKKLCGLFLILLVFTSCYFLVRISLLPEALNGEEGIFADLIVHRPSGPFYGLYGRLEGKNIYGYIGHPAGIYETLRLSGWIFQKFLASPVYLNDELITPRLRVICSFYQLIFWGLLLAMVYWNRSFPRGWSILLVFTGMLSPLAIKTSLQLQTDNTCGILFCGAAAGLFALASRSSLRVPLKGILLFLGGFLAGTGKQEWSLALFLALLLTAGMYRFFSDSTSGKPLPSLAVIAAGILAGNLASYFFDPVNYSLGMHYFLSFSNVTPVSQAHWSFFRWLELMQFRLPFLFACIVFSAALFYFGAVRKQGLPFLPCLVAFFGLFLTAEYIFSDHSRHLRYFAPGLAVLTVALLMLLPDRIAGWDRRVLLIAIASVGVSTLVYLMGYGPDPGYNLDPLLNDQGRLPPNTVLYIGYGTAWNKPDIDFVGNNMDYEKQKEKIYQQYGKNLVYPESLRKAP